MGVLLSVVAKSSTPRKDSRKQLTSSTLKKEGSEQLRLTFEKGELKAVNDEKFDDPIKAIQKVEEIGAAYGIGRDMHVGDTIIGIKGRVGFEAAAPMLIIAPIASSRNIHRANGSNTGKTK